MIAAVQFVGLVAGCSKEQEQSATTEQSSSQANRPGQCKHGVDEAVCPKCNPALAAVFQAKGDWCAEHGFPESFCPLCHPERGGKPGVATSKDEAPAHGLKVKLSAETEKRAGIQTVRASASIGSSQVPVTARVVYDATKQARLNARAPGVVRDLRVDIGSQVKKGDALVSIDSPAVGADRARLTAANAHLAIATANYERQSQLRRDNITSEKELLASSQALEAAKGEVAALAASLSVIGASGGSGGSYILRAPFDGVVTERSATIGTLVQLDQVLIEVVDTAKVWVELDVPESELGRIQVGQRAYVSVDALTNREFEGSLVYLAPSVDSHTRTTRARVDIENPDGLLRANMFGRARIAVSDEVTAVRVPRAAVQKAKSVDVAFVRKSPGDFETRRVTLGSSDGEFVEVRSGIVAGEDVVTTGSFLLKTETLKDSIGAGCCETD